MDQLCAVAMAVKNMRDSHRQTTLVEELKGVADKFVGKFRLPLDPSLLVKSIDIEVQNAYTRGGGGGGGGEGGGVAFSKKEGDILPGTCIRT